MWRFVLKFEVEKTYPHMHQTSVQYCLRFIMVCTVLPSPLSPTHVHTHLAYTIAKYGMSLCVLGMAEELKEDGIAVNALWPRTCEDACSSLAWWCKVLPSLEIFFLL